MEVVVKIKREGKVRCTFTAKELAGKSKRVKTFGVQQRVNDFRKLGDIKKSGPKLSIRHHFSRSMDVPRIA